MRLTMLVTLAVTAALALGGSADAQETGTPVFSAPDRAFSKHEFGLSLSAPNGADLGLESFYSFASGRNDFGLRRWGSWTRTTTPTWSWEAASARGS